MNLLRSASLLALASLALSAHALSLALDSPIVQVVRPLDGQVRFDVFGTVSLGPGETLTDFRTDSPSMEFGRPLPTNANLGVIGALQTMGTYTGTFAFGTVQSTDPFGLYLFNSAGTGPAVVTFQVRNLDGTFTRRTESFGVQVNPVPEPATMAALGLGAVAMMRRRKRA